MFVTAPVPPSPVLETQISTLRVRPSTRPNDRFLERSPLSLLAGDPPSWPERAPPGKPNTARLGTPPFLLMFAGPGRHQGRYGLARRGTTCGPPGQEVASWTSSSSGSSSVTAG